MDFDPQVATDAAADEAEELPSIVSNPKGLLAGLADGSITPSSRANSVQGRAHEVRFDSLFTPAADEDLYGLPADDEARGFADTQEQLETPEIDQELQTHDAEV